MVKESFCLVVALAFVATAIGTVAADNRPVVEVKSNDLLFKVPVYEDVIFSEKKWELIFTHYKNIKQKLLEVTDMVIIKRKGYFSVATRAWAFFGLFNKYINANKELARSGDLSPREKKSYGQEMSKLVEQVLATRADQSNLNDRQTYERVEIVMDGIEQVMRQSPVALYMDWNRLTIDGESMAQYLAPVVYWMHQNGYGMLLRVVSMVGRLFVKIGS